MTITGPPTTVREEPISSTASAPQGLKKSRTIASRITSLGLRRVSLSRRASGGEFRPQGLTSRAAAVICGTFLMWAVSGGIAMDLLCYKKLIGYWVVVFLILTSASLVFALPRYHVSGLLAADACDAVTFMAYFVFVHMAMWTLSPAARGSHSTSQHLHDLVLAPVVLDPAVGQLHPTEFRKDSEVEAWMTGPLMDALFCETADLIELRPGQPSCFLADRNLITLSGFRLKVQRSQTGDCEDPLFFPPPLRCQTEEEEKTPWILGNRTVEWKEDRFLIRNGNIVSTLSMIGKEDTYSTGGYFFYDTVSTAMTATGAKAAMARLFADGLVDRQTRLLRLDGYVSSPSTNMWLETRVIVERSRGGALAVWAAFESGAFLVDLPFAWDGIRATVGQTSPAMEMQFAIYSLMLFFAFSIFCEILDRGVSQYFAGGTAWVDTLQVVVMAVSFALRLTSYMYIPNAETPLNPWIEWSVTVFFSVWERHFLACSVFLAWIRIIRFLQLFPRMDLLARTLNRARKDITVFFLLFAIVLAGFVTAFHTTFGEKISHFSDIPTTAFTMLRAIDSGLDAHEMYASYRSLGFFAALMFILTMLTLLTFLVAILTNAFTATLDDIMRQDGRAEKLTPANLEAALLAPLSGNRVVVDVVAWGADDVTKKDYTSKSDPYLQVDIVDQSRPAPDSHLPADASFAPVAQGFKTSVEQNTHSPRWNEHSSIQLSESPDWTDLALRVLLWDADMSKSDDLIGHALIDLAPQVGAAGPSRHVVRLTPFLSTIFRKRDGSGRRPLARSGSIFQSRSPAQGGSVRALSTLLSNVLGTDGASSKPPLVELSLRIKLPSRVAVDDDHVETERPRTAGGKKWRATGSVLEGKENEAT